MRVTHIQSTFVAPLGGAESYVLALASAQAEHGHDVTIVTAWTDPEAAARAREAGVTVQVLTSRRPYRPDQHGSDPVRKALFHAMDLWRALVGSRAFRDVQREDTVVHVHRFQGIGPFVLRARASAVVHTAHDYCLVDTTSTSVRDGREPERLGWMQRLRARVIWWSARRATVLIFPSARTLTRHHQLGMPEHGVAVRVIPHGWPAPAAILGRSPSERPRFVFLGKLHASKGIDLLLRAWALIDVDADLVIAGDGPLRPAVESAAARGLVTYVGWVSGSRKAELISSATALVFPSLWPETFGLVIAESLLMGCPVVATPQAAGALVIDGENGLVAAEASPAALAEVLRRLASDVAVRDRLAQGAITSAQALDFDVHVETIEAVYREAQATTRAHRR